MKEVIKMVILGDPQAQKRHRHFHNKKAGRIQNYDPSSGDKADFLSIIQSSAPEKPLEGPLRMSVDFFFARPKSHYRTGKNSSELKPSAPMWHTSKPDRDNLDKFCMDAMKGIFFRDDAQVCLGRIRKMYSDMPRTEIEIVQID